MALIVGFALARENHVNRFTSRQANVRVTVACATSGHSLFPRPPGIFPDGEIVCLPG
jgi:hypothetical protein